MKIEGFENAVGIFFRRPGLDYVRQVRRALDSDPEFLKSHRDDVTYGVKRVLRAGGISWDEDVLTESAIKLVWEAVVRLRCVENGGRERGV
jgi:hypothetical protein